ncbi:MAG: hypothetical protein E7058_10340 [Lentisphaerae bacterium]|nr:hypothetical protein [Lentisphaerota bacterium]
MLDIPDVFNGGFNGSLVESELKNEAAKRRLMHQLPFNLNEWDPAALREKIWQALGVRVDHSVPLDIQITGKFEHDGYTIWKLCYQSRPGVYVTGNLYVPAGKGPFPAVINMHGHWESGRLASRVQERGHLLAKSGYVCLAVDAFGTGERCPEHGVYVSHGGLLGGAPFQFGETLMGLQVVDNMRGVDLLQSLDFVIKDKIGACGASGGGNQTMWLAAMDERITAAVPVVSVGTFESYIICPNCICEVLPGGLDFTEEAGVLALIAPRALMTLNGVFDVNPAFNPAQTRRSTDEAKRIFRAYGVPNNIRQVTFEEPHAFSPQGRRAMIGWFDYHLKGIGDGEPVENIPDFTTLPMDEMMVFEKGKRPANVVSLPSYVVEKEAYWKEHAVFSKENLAEILHLEKVSIQEKQEFSSRYNWERIGIRGNDGRLMPMVFRAPAEPDKAIVILGTPYKKLHLQQNELIGKLLADGMGVAIIDLWGSGENDMRIDGSYRDRFINRSLMWLGKNSQGKWVEDFILAEEYLLKRFPDAVIAAGGIEEGGIAATLFAALRDAGTDLYLEGAPASLTYSPARSKTFGQTFIIPGILKCGDMEEFKKQAGGKVVETGSVN